MVSGSAGVRSFVVLLGDVDGDGREDIVSLDQGPRWGAIGGTVGAMFEGCALPP